MLDNSFADTCTFELPEIHDQDIAQNPLVIDHLHAYKPTTSPISPADHFTRPATPGSWYNSSTLAKLEQMCSAFDIPAQVTQQKGEPVKPRPLPATSTASPRIPTPAGTPTSTTATTQSQPIHGEQQEEEEKPYSVCRKCKDFTDDADIFCCKKGHLVCSNCNKKSTTCLECGLTTRLDEHFTKAFQINKFHNKIRYCPAPRCLFMGDLDLLLDHFKTCHYLSHTLISKNKPNYFKINVKPEDLPEIRSQESYYDFTILHREERYPNIIFILQVRKEKANWVLAVNKISLRQEFHLFNMQVKIRPVNSSGKDIHNFGCDPEEYPIADKCYRSFRNEYVNNFPVIKDRDGTCSIMAGTITIEK